MTAPRLSETQRPRPRLVELPDEIVGAMYRLADRRAVPLFQAHVGIDDTLRTALLAVYLQGIADGYEAGRRALKEPQNG